MSKPKYSLIVNGKRQTVPKKVYKAYHKMREHERYLEDLALDCERSLERFAEDGVKVEYQVAMTQPSLADSFDHKQLIDRLRKCLGNLSVDDRNLITAIVCDKKSDRNVAEMLKIPQTTVSYRKRKILIALRKMIGG